LPVEPACGDFQPRTPTPSGSHLRAPSVDKMRVDNPGCMNNVFSCNICSKINGSWHLPANRKTVLFRNYSAATPVSFHFISRMSCSDSLTIASHRPSSSRTQGRPPFSFVNEHGSSMSMRFMVCYCYWPHVTEAGYSKACL